MTVAAFNELEPEAALGVIGGCCGSRDWAEGVVAGRPFADVAAVLDAGDRQWASLPDADRLAAIEAHAPIGALAAADARERREQAGAADADQATREELAARNEDYRARFGFVFLTDATGRDAGDLLRELRARLTNTAEQERANAEEQQLRIIRRRLRRAIGELDPVRVSTHVLDVGAGAPAAGLDVAISESHDQREWVLVDTCATDESGRVAGVDVPRSGWVQLSFAAADYLRRDGRPEFFGEVVVVFAAGDRPRAHVPLLLAPFGYSTYLGT